MKRKLTYELYRKTKTRTVNISFAFVIAVSTLSSALPLLFSQTALADSPTVVTPSKLQDWGKFPGTGKISFVTASDAPSGTGALQLDTPTNDAETQLYRDITPTPVDSLHDLGYSVKRLSGESYASPSYVLGIDTNGDSNDDFYAWFEPVYNGGNNYDQWQTYSINPSSSKFWTGHAFGPLAGGNGQNFFTLDDVAKDFPGAKVIDLTINQGSGNAGWSTLVDNVKFDDATYDFEQDAPDAPTNLRFVKGSTSVADGSSINYTGVTLLWNTVPNAERYQVQVTDPNGNSQSNRNTGWYTFALNDPSRYGFFGSVEGTWTYQVRTKDATTGLWSLWSSPVSLTYDHTAPTVSFAAPTPADNAYVNNTFHVKVIANDNLGNDFVAVDVRTKDNPDSGSNPNNWRANCTNSTVSGTKTAETYECDVNTSGLNDGETYTLRASARDKAGNWGKSSYQLFTVNRDAPTAPTNLRAKFQYDNNSVANGTYLNIAAKPGNNNLVLNWDQQSGDWVDHYLVHVTYPDGSTNTTWQGSNTNAWLNANGFGQHGDGTYSYEVEAVNPNGSSTSGSFVLRYDTTAPVVDTPVTYTDASGSTKGANNAFVHGNVTFHVSQTEVNPQRMYVEYDQLVNNKWQKKTGQWFYNTDNADLAANTANWGDGTYQLKISSDDLAWNHSGYSAGFTIDNIGPDSTNDMPSLVSGTVTIHQTITDNVAPASGKLRIWKLDSNGKADNSQFFASAPINVDSNGVVTYVLDSVANLHGDGQYLAKFTSTDTAGNGTVQQTYFTVDNTAPSTPVATPGAGNYQSTQLVSLSSDDATGSGIDSIWYTVDGSTPSKSNGTQYIGAFTVSNSETVKAVAYDAAGNASDVLSAAYTITTPVQTNTDQDSQGGSTGFTPGPQTFAPAATFSAAHATTLQGDNGNTQSSEDGTTQNGDNSSGVLGAHTTNTSSNDTVNVQNAADKKSGNFLWLGWWWLLVIAAIIALLYFATSRNSRSRDAS